MIHTARRLQLPLSGGSDAHWASRVGRVYTVFERDINSLSDLVAEIKAGRLSFEWSSSPDTVQQPRSSPVNYNGGPAEILRALFERERYVPSHSDMDRFTGDARSLAESAPAQGFSVYSVSSPDPRVILVGNTHKGTGIDQRKEIVQFLSSSMKPGDLLMCENSDNLGIYEVDYPSYRRDDLVGELKGFLSANKIRTIMNDKTELRAAHWEAVCPVSKEIAQGTLSDACARKFLDAQKARDNSFCYNPVVGMIPILRGTARLHNPPQPGSRIFQVVGFGHLTANTIVSNLENEGIGYIALEPRNK